MNKKEFDKQITNLKKLYVEYKVAEKLYDDLLCVKTVNLISNYKDLFSDKLKDDWKNDVILNVDYDGAIDLIAISIKLVDLMSYKLIIYIKGKEHLQYQLNYGKSTKHNDYTDLSKVLLTILNDEEDFILKTNEFIEESLLRVLYDRKCQRNKQLYDSINEFINQFTFPLSEKEIKDYNEVLKMYESNVDDCDTEFRFRHMILNVLRYVPKYEGD